MKNFFKGISLSSIAAGALAAVTSFLLSAKIGIAGSVIGVAIGSIVAGGAAGPRITRPRARAADRRLGRRTAAVARR